jgi:transposase
MSARTALHIPRPGAAAHRHRPSGQPSLEQLQHENERLQRELEELRRKIIERDQRIAETERRIAETDRQIADAERRVAEVEKQIADGQKQMVEAEKQIAEAEKQIADLERQLGLRQQNSTNSSKPPSSDGLAGAPRPRGRGKKSRRKVGGQPGHRGAHRPPVPAERVNEVRPVLPEQCQHCGHSLPPPVATTDTPQRHQVIELPPFQPHVIEYQCHQLACPACGKSTRAAIPEEARGDFGPQLAALITYLTVVCRMPRRVVRELLAHALGIEISLGSVQKCWEEASQAVATPCQELEEQLKDEPVLNVDETGWRTNGDKRYLWAWVAARYVVYTIAATRGSKVLVDLLGAVFRGILCSDRFSAYLKYHSGQAQFCWAHLKRNLLGILDLTKNSEVERFCRDALAQHARLFRLWHKFRGGQLDRSPLLLRALPIREKIAALAERHRESCHREVRNLAQALFQHNGRLFTFLEHEGVEPTNNSVERALRIGVQWRKICFGNRSATGELATSRLLTVAETCELQRLNLLVYLSTAIACHRRRQQVASLLPR